MPPRRALPAAERLLLRAAQWSGGRFGRRGVPVASRRLSGRWLMLFASSITILLMLTLSCTTRGDRREQVEFWGLGREGEVVADMIPEFERRNPTVHVVIQQIPFTAAHEKLLTAFVGDATPDVAQMGNTWIPEFSEVGALEDLTDRAAKSPSVTKADYFPGIWATNVVRGRTYGVPWYVDTRVLFYRTDMLAAVGFKQPPRTWSEWSEAMRRIKASGRARYAILLPTNEWEEPVVLALGSGSPLLADGGRYGAFRQPDFVRAFDFYLGMFRQGYAPAVSNSQVSNLYQQFAQGDFAMYITGPWNVAEFRRRLPASMEGRWSTAPIPAMTAGRPGVSLAGGSSLVIFHGSQRKNSAWKLIEFLSEPAQQIRFYELATDLPARRSAWSVKALAEDKQFPAFREQLEHVVPLPPVPEWEQIATSIYEHGEATIRGKSTEAAALADLDARANEILAKRRWMLDREAAVTKKPALVSSLPGTPKENMAVGVTLARARSTDRSVCATGGADVAQTLLSVPSFDSVRAARFALAAVRGAMP
jgi:multiple sugar transport system substrate-binding protein